MPCCVIAAAFVGFALRRRARRRQEATAVLEVAGWTGDPVSGGNR